MRLLYLGEDNSVSAFTCWCSYSIMKKNAVKIAILIADTPPRGLEGMGDDWLDVKKICPY